MLLLLALPSAEKPAEDGWMEPIHRAVWRARVHQFKLQDRRMIHTGVGVKAPSLIEVSGYLPSCILKAVFAVGGGVLCVVCSCLGVLFPLPPTLCVGCVAVRVCLPHT